MGKLTVTALSLAGALALSACGGSSPSAAECQDQAFFDENRDACIEAARSAGAEALGSEAPSVTEDPATEEPELPPLEGPATEPAVYPGGVTAEIVSVEAAPAESWVAEEQPGHDTMVRITVELSAGPDGYPLTADSLGPNGPNGNLFYGPNRTEANGWHVDQEFPTLVTEESPVTLVEEFSLPADGLTELVYVYTPDAEFEEPWTFTGVQGLM